MLKLDNVSCPILLKNFSLHISAEEFHIILGPSGSGKTFLLETVLGLNQVERGNIYFQGKNITNTSVEKRLMSYVPQDLALFPHFNVKENILYGRSDNNVNDQFISNVITSVEIEHLLDRDIKKLSGGEGQRVALARAIISQQKLLILDEPLASLHESMKRELWFLLKDLQKNYKLTILMVTHDLEEAFFLSDNISIILNGKIHQRGDKFNIYSKPNSPAVARFLGVNNIFQGNVVHSTQDETFAIYCPQLVGKITLFDKKDQHVMGEEICFAIRAENVMILRDDYSNQNKSNVFLGDIVNIFPQGAIYTVWFQPLNTKQIIEIELPSYAFNKLKLSTHGHVRITLKAEDLVIFPN